MVTSTPAIYPYCLTLSLPDSLPIFCLYVPNDLPAAQINKLLRLPLMEALTKVDAPEPATSFRVAVNPELIDAHLTAPISMQSAPPPTQVSRPAPDDAGEAASPDRKSTRLNSSH